LAFSGGTRLSVESLETIGLSSTIAVLYGVFFCWYASRNRKIDVYVKPRFFGWQVRTGLLALGTSVIIYIGHINFMVFTWMALPFAFLLSPPGVVSAAVAIPLLLAAVLFAVVAWHAPLFLFIILGIPIMISPLFGSPLPSNAYQIYLLVLIGVIPVVSSLLISAEASIDALVFRIEEVGNYEAAELVDEKGRIGLNVVLWGVVLPGAVFTRWIRRGTKTGKIHVTISSKMVSPHAIREQYVEVILPKMRAK
jgi:hypothetical protein